MSNRKKSSAVAVPVVPVPHQFEPLLVPVAEAAHILSVSPWEVRRLVRKGVLAVKKIGKTHWLIPVASLRKFSGAI